jgi:hypothetical protein
LLEDQERKNVLNYISRTIQQQTGTATPKIFPVSSRMGLKSRLAGDSEGYARSGLAVLEESLAAFLSSEKSDILLVAILNKLLRLSGQRPELAEFEKRVVTLRDAFSQHLPSEAVLKEAVALEPPKPVKEALSVETAAKTIETDELLKVLETRGCPVCDYLAETAFNFFAKWQYDLSSNEQTQQVFAVMGRVKSASRGRVKIGHY